jgi:signal transduction histidine kinase
VEASASTPEARITRGGSGPGKRGTVAMRPKRVPHAIVAGGEAWLEAVDSAASDAAAAALAESIALVSVPDEVPSEAQPRGDRAQRVAPYALDRALADYRLSDAPPLAALRAQAMLIAGALQVAEISVWSIDEAGDAACLVPLSVRGPRRAQTAAELAAERGVPTVCGSRAPLLAVPISRLGLVHGALVVRLGRSQDLAAVERLTTSAATRLSPVLHRLNVLEGSEEQERSLVEVAERRLVRIGYDLHDGALQEVAVLAEEVRLLALDVAPLVDEPSRTAVHAGFESVREQVCRLGVELRALAQSLETSSVSQQPLEELLQREVESLERRTSIACRVEIAGVIVGLTDSQRIALYRVVQEALSNVAEHSAAATVTIRVWESPGAVGVSISDDGRGFDSSAGLDAAAKRGRLGLVGICERVRLLGGAFQLKSAPGRGTTVSVALDRWAPPEPASPVHF